MIEIVGGRVKEPALRAELIAEIVRLNKVVDDILAMLVRTNEVAANAADKIIACSERQSEVATSTTFDLGYEL